MQKKYLLIGGAGFIGVNFAKNLLERGDHVTVFDNFSRKGTENNIRWLENTFKQVEVIKGDIRTDFEKLCSLVEDFDVVHHLAAQVAVTTSTTNPREDFEINALGTFNILEAVRLSKKRPTLIYASTNKVYGEMTHIKTVEKDSRYSYVDIAGITENENQDFHSPYGCSKGSADHYVKDYARIYDLNTIVMRQSCIYGPHQFGIEDQGWVAWFVIAAELEQPITIYGNGKQVRDILHVDDLFNVWDLAEKNIETTRGQAFNIGGGPTHTTSLLEFLSGLETIIGKKIPLTFSDWRPGDQPVYISDISKAQNILSWKPAIAAHGGLEDLHNWVKDNKAIIENVLKSK